MRGANLRWKWHCMETRARCKQRCSLLHMTGAGRPISSDSGSDKDPVMMTACRSIPADCFWQQIYNQHPNLETTFCFVWQIRCTANSASHMISVPEFDWTGTWKSDFVEVEDDSPGWKMIKNHKLLSVLEKSSWRMRRFFFVSTTCNNDFL